MSRRTVVQLRADPKIAVGYVRVSTEGQKLGPEAQEGEIRAWAAKEGVDVVDIQRDLGISGKTPYKERKGLTAAVESLPVHSAGLLIVAKRDRLARAVEVAAEVVILVEKVGAQIVSADGTGNYQDGPEGGLIRGMMDLFAQYERTLIASRIRSAFKIKRARGEKLGGWAPFGKLAIQRPEGSDPKTVPVYMVDNPEELAVLERIRTLRAKGLSLRTIVRELNDSKTPCRGKCWHLSSVVAVLKLDAGLVEKGSSGV
jgi:DNA invertase Pin-like site-specific DNA recombinase